MTLASSSSYPLLNAFWTILFLFLWILWFFLLFWIIFDIFRSPDLSGWGKALWLIFVIILPYLGVFVYLIARGHKMAEHSAQQAHAQDQMFQDRVKDVVGSAQGSSTADQLAKLAELRNQGVLTEDEFAAQKAKLLA